MYGGGGGAAFGGLGEGDKVLGEGRWGGVSIMRIFLIRREGVKRLGEKYL